MDARIVDMLLLWDAARGATLAEGSDHVPSERPLACFPPRKKKGSLLRSVPSWPITHSVTLVVPTMDKKSWRASLVLLSNWIRIVLTLFLLF